MKPGSYEPRVSSLGYAPVVRPGIMVPSSELAFALTPVRRLENVTPGRYSFVVDGGAPEEVEVREGAVAVLALP